MSVFIARTRMVDHTSRLDRRTPPGGASTCCAIQAGATIFIHAIYCRLTDHWYLFSPSTIGNYNSQHAVRPEKGLKSREVLVVAEISA